jgi:hypothetical protein
MGDMNEGQCDDESQAPAAPSGGPLKQAERLRVLLFVLREKLDQRRSLHQKATGALLILSVCCLAAAIFCPYYVWVVSEGERSFWSLAYFAALAVSPFVLAVIHYFWTTFAQIFFKGLPASWRAALFKRAEYAELGDGVPLEVLADDSRLLSLFLNLFAVDVGMGSVLFFMCAVLLVLGPLVVQAGLSVAVVYLLLRDGLPTVAAGLGVLYVLFFALTCMTGWTFYRALRRGTGSVAR